jgi:hypothetical protein
MTLAIWTDVVALMRVQLRPFQGRDLSPDLYRWWSICTPPPANCLQASGLRTKGIALDIPLTIILAVVLVRVLVVECRTSGRLRGRDDDNEDKLLVLQSAARSRTEGYRH